MRAANHKFACWVDMIFDLIVEQLCVFFIFRFYTWDQDVNNIILDLRQHFCFGIKIIVLCRNNDRVDANRLVVIVVFKRYLAFCIGAQVFDLLCSRCAELPVQSRILCARSSASGI